MVIEPAEDRLQLLADLALAGQTALAAGAIAQAIDPSPAVALEATGFGFIAALIACFLLARLGSSEGASATRSRPLAQRVRLLVYFVSGLVVLLVPELAPPAVLFVPWALQLAMLTQRDDPALRRVGAWNVGMITVLAMSYPGLLKAAVGALYLLFFGLERAFAQAAAHARRSRLGLGRLQLVGRRASLLGLGVGVSLALAYAIGRAIVGELSTTVPGGASFLTAEPLPGGAAVTLVTAVTRLVGLLGAGLALGFVALKLWGRLAAQRSRSTPEEEEDPGIDVLFEVELASAARPAPAPPLPISTDLLAVWGTHERELARRGHPRPRALGAVEHARALPAGVGDGAELQAAAREFSALRYRGGEPTAGALDRLREASRRAFRDDAPRERDDGAPD